MKINFWDCEYREISNDTFGCSHSHGTGYCELDNRLNGEEEDCELLDSKLDNQLNNKLDNNLKTTMNKKQYKEKYNRLFK